MFLANVTSVEYVVALNFGKIGQVVFKSVRKYLSESVNSLYDRLIF